MVAETAQTQSNQEQQRPYWQHHGLSQDPFPFPLQSTGADTKESLDLKQTTEFLKKSIRDAGSKKLPFTKEDIIFIQKKSRGNRAQISRIARDIMIAKCHQRGKDAWYHDRLTQFSLVLIVAAGLIYTGGRVRRFQLDHPQASRHILQRMSKITKPWLEKANSLFKPTHQVYNDQARLAQNEVVYDDMPDAIAQGGVYFAAKAYHPQNYTTQDLSFVKRSKAMKQIGEYAYYKLENSVQNKLNRIVDYTAHYPLQTMPYQTSSINQLPLVKRAKSLDQLGRYLGHQSKKYLQASIQSAYQQVEIERMQQAREAKILAVLERSTKARIAEAKIAREQRIAREKARVQAALKRQQQKRELALREKRLREERLALAKAKLKAKIEAKRKAKRLAQRKRRAELAAAKIRRENLLSAIREEMHEQRTPAAKPKPRAPEVAAEYAQNRLDPDALDSFQDLDEMRPLADAATYSTQTDDHIVEVFQAPPKRPVTRTAFHKPKPASQQKARYTVQLANVQNPETLKLLIEQYGIKNTKIIKKIRDHKTAYVLVTGDFPNRQAAKSQLKSLPTEIQSLHPWVRNMNELS